MNISSPINYFGAMPQDVVGRAGQNAIFITYKVLDTETTLDTLKDLCGSFSTLIRSIDNRYPEGNFSAVVGFGSDLWTRYFEHLGHPSELAPFKEIKGDKHTAVSTPGDLFFHLRASQMSICYEFAATLDQILSDIVEPIDETQGFRFRDGRAIIGFVDGTENPSIDLDPLFFGVIGQQEPAFTGGSYAFAQKYLHDMKKWNQTPVEEQEKVIGRFKFSDIEMSDEQKPENAHNAVTNIEDEQGNPLKIIRGNMPFANTSRSEYGTYFIGYASTFTTTQKMLENMFVGSPKGNTDRLLDFSTTVTGNMFFIPSYDMLTLMSS